MAIKLQISKHGIVKPRDYTVLCYPVQYAVHCTNMSSSLHQSRARRLATWGGAPGWCNRLQRGAQGGGAQGWNTPSYSRGGAGAVGKIAFTKGSPGVEPRGGAQGWCSPL